MQDQHIASAFDRDLEAVQAQIMKMGGLVENAIRLAAQSLETRDGELAEDVTKPLTRWRSRSMKVPPVSLPCGPRPRLICGSS